MRLPHFVPPGFLKYYILKLISKKPMHGYEIMSDIEQKSNGYWRPSAGSIYPMLIWLKIRGLIEPVAKKEGGKQVYQITAKGQNHLSKFMENVDNISERIQVLGAFWWDFLYPQTKAKNALRFLESHFRHLKNGIDYASLEDLDEFKLIINNMKEDLALVSKEIDLKLHKR